MRHSLFILGFLLITGRAEATLQYVFVTDTVDQFAQWSIKGTGDSVSVLNDGVDANYLFSKSTADTNKYYLQQIAIYDFEHIDRIDSIQVRLRGQDFIVGGSATLQWGVLIDADISWGSTNNFDDQTWVNVSRTFTVPPGSRGNWDKTELDSAVVILNPTAISNDSIGVTSCSVFVYVTPAVPYRMYFTKDTSNCAPGSNFSKAMSKFKPVVIDTVKVHVPILTTETDYFVTKANYPNNGSWGTTGFVVKLDVVKNVPSAVNSDSVRFRVSRLNSSCTIQESTPYTAWTFISGTGAKSISINAHTFTAGSCGDLARLEMQSQNFLSVTEDSLWFTVGVNESRLDMDFPFNVQGCPAEQGVVCGGLEDTLRIQDTTTNMQQWSRYNAYGFQKDTFQITAFQESYGTSAGAKVLSMQDRISGTAIFEQTATDTQRFILDNTNMGASPTISTMWGYAYARRKAATGTTTFRMRLMRDGQTFYCESGDLTLNGQYTLYTFQFSGVPTGAGSCAGALTVTALDSLNIAFVATAVAANDTVLVGQFDLYACYASGAVAPKTRRKKMLQLSEVREEDTFVLTGDHPYMTAPLWGADE